MKKMNAIPLSSNVVQRFSIRLHVRQLLSLLLTSRVTSSGRLAGGRVEMELAVIRHMEARDAAKQTHAKLLVGCVNDDRILLHEHIVLEYFPAPYKVNASP